MILTQAVALRDQQEVILRTLLDPQSPRGADGNVVEIVATDPLVPPQAETAPHCPNWSNARGKRGPMCGRQGCRSLMASVRWRARRTRRSRKSMSMVPMRAVAW
jgi:hypothetical protein